MSVATIMRREIYESGTEPEHFVTHLPKHERAGIGSVRLYLAVERHGELHLKSTAVIPASALRTMARVLDAIADELGLPFEPEFLSS